MLVSWWRDDRDGRFWGWRLFARWKVCERSGLASHADVLRLVTRYERLRGRLDLDKVLIPFDGAKWWNCEFTRSKDVLALLPTEFGKSLLFQLIPGLCMSYSQSRAFLIPSPGEQRFERVLIFTVCSFFFSTNKILFVILFKFATAPTVASNFSMRL